MSRGSSLTLFLLCCFWNSRLISCLLKGIPIVLSPSLLHTIAAMGHGDELVFGDANFPAFSVAKHRGAKFIDASGLEIPPLLEAVLQFFPLESESAAAVMDVSPKDKANGLQVPVWDVYQKILNNANNGPYNMTKIERFKYYERAKLTFAVVATGETAVYGNIIITKGVVGASQITNRAVGDSQWT